MFPLGVKRFLHIQGFFSRHSVGNSPASMYVRRPCMSGVHVRQTGRAEPLCAKIDGANREVSEGKADL